MNQTLGAPQILRSARNPEVCVCIPTYQAERFLDRALHCALGQTYSNLRIIVSVDRSTDNTAMVARTFARTDKRVSVIEHSERLGWCRNVNALLDQVDTPWFFLYFHDDFIMPQYCERLRSALIKDSTAATAHCSMAMIGSLEKVQLASSYEGSLPDRLAKLWTSSSRGNIYRSLIRSSAFDMRFRLCSDDLDNAARGEDLLMELIAAGPAAAVPEILYIRWLREGGLTAGWAKLPFDRLVASWSRELDRCYRMLDELVPSKSENAPLKFALMLFLLQRLRDRTQKDKIPLPYPRELHTDVPDLTFPPGVERFEPETLARLKTAHSALIKIYAQASAST